MSDSIITVSGRSFQRFVSSLTGQLTKPKVKFVSQLLCAVLLSHNLILTEVASRVPCGAKLTPIAKRFRRQLADGNSYLRKLWSNYLCLLKRRLKISSLLIVDLTDLAKPYAKKMEYLALVRDADKDRLVQGTGTWRHNWAGQLPIQVVQQLVGHSDISTTRKYCLTARCEDMASANRVLTSVLDGVRVD